MSITEGKEREQRTESLFKQKSMRTYQTYIKSWTLESKKVTEHLIISMLNELL